MKKHILKYSILAVSMSAIFSASANDIVVDVNEPNAQPAQAEQEQISERDRELIRVVLAKAGREENLTPAELETIKRKEHVLFRYLYEQQQLGELRALLEDEKRSEQKRQAVLDEYPYSPSELVKLRQLDTEIKKASNSPLNGPVTFDIKTMDIDVDARHPIQVKVAKGYSSSIMFFDQTGTPWPIEGDIIGDVNSFKSYPMEGKPHVGVFEITSEFKESNALVNLKGLNVPVVVRLSGSNDVIDARISIRIPKFGPDARQSNFIQNKAEETDPSMLTVLNGDRLNGAKEFKLSGVQGTVWYKDGMLYVRTVADLISPPWKEEMKSPTGYNVYKLAPVTNLLFSVDGEMKGATVEKGFEVKIRQKQSIFDK